MGETALLITDGDPSHIDCMRDVYTTKLRNWHVMYDQFKYRKRKFISQSHLCNLEKYASEFVIHFVIRFMSSNVQQIFFYWLIVNDKLGHAKWGLNIYNLCLVKFCQCDRILIWYHNTMDPCISRTQLQAVRMYFLMLHANFFITLTLLLSWFCRHSELGGVSGFLRLSIITCTKNSLVFAKLS